MCLQSPVFAKRKAVMRFWAREGHRRRIQLLILCWVIASLGSVESMSASGSYRSSAPRRRSEVEQVDIATYELGRRLYSGMLRLGDADSVLAPTQEVGIKALARRLPKNEARSAGRLEALAGRLSDSQFKALRYFLQQRFELSE